MLRNPYLLLLVLPFMVSAQDQVPILDFEILPPHGSLAAFEVSADGQTVFLSNLNEDLVKVWSLSEGRETHRFESPTPVDLLHRGDRLFVLNRGPATVSVYNSKTWEQEDELAVDCSEPYAISAPKGDAFGEYLLISGGKSPTDHPSKWLVPNSKESSLMSSRVSVCAKTSN